MQKRFSKELLYQIRNRIPLNKLCQHLDYPCKDSEGYQRFLCPKCNEFNTAINTENNLGRCFRCQENYNTIDLTMTLKNKGFKEAVNLLNDLL